MPDIALRAYQESDADAVNRTALAAFEEYKDRYDDWPGMARNVSRMSLLARDGELIVAEWEGRVCGAVGYIPPGRPRVAVFNREWPIVRLLVVDPAARGRGVGRKLIEACVARARRDRADLIALQTSPIMSIALPMYLRLGFVRAQDAPPIHGVPYAVYLKRLAE